MTDLTKAEANKLIADKLAEIEKLYEECEAIADANQVRIRIDGPTYGMGGYYTPRTKPKDEDAYEDEEGWQASSQSC